MFSNLSALGYGIVVFAVVIMVGVVILPQFGEATLECPTGFTLNLSGSKNSATACCNTTTGTGICKGINATHMVDQYGANATSTYIIGQLGSSGLAGWTPVIIALSIGILFLGLFMSGGLGKLRKY